jgi:hypothetical protein
MHRLKGIPERWELYQLDPEDEDVTVAAQPSALRPTGRLAITGARHPPRLMQTAGRVDGAWTAAAPDDHELRA